MCRNGLEGTGSRRECCEKSARVTAEEERGKS